MSNLQTPFRYDFVGSFLRPQALKDAKAAYQAGEISKETFDRVAEEEVAKVVAKQKELGYHVITDGEFRRAFWHLDFMWGFEGVAHEDTGNGVQFDAELALLEDTYLVGKIKAKAHPFVEYFKFLKQFEDENTVAKYTIPAPAQTFQQMIVPANYERTRKIYATNEELIQDIGKAYQDVIQQFYDAGCRNLQFDDCTWGAIVGDAAEQRYQALGIDLNDVKAQLLAVNNLALEGKPADMIINSHICRGNYHSTYFTSGPYDSVADYVFAKENVNALFLEYDDERSGGFAPLAKVSADKKVVLGLLVDIRDNYEVLSNRESGFGRYDVVLVPREKGRDAFVMEFKVFDDSEESGLEDTVAAALRQIDEKNYDTQLLDRKENAEAEKRFQDKERSIEL